jgi:hypothetical protein
MLGPTASAGQIGEDYSPLDVLPYDLPVSKWYDMRRGVSYIADNGAFRRDLVIAAKESSVGYQRGG